MLCKIGEHAAVLQEPGVLRALSAGGYSSAYQAAKLYEALEGSQRQRIQELIRLLSREGITRDTIAGIAKSAKQRIKTHKGIDPVAEKRSAHYELVAFRPTRSDLQLIGATYATADTLRRAVGLYDDLAERAAAVVFTPLHYLPAVAEKLLPACGFGRPKHVFLLQRPTSPSLYDVEVAVITERGPGQSIRVDSVDWLPDGNKFDRAAYAEKLLPNAKSKLLMFSGEQVKGWDTRTWVEEPTS